MLYKIYIYIFWKLYVCCLSTRPFAISSPRCSIYCYDESIFHFIPYALRIGMGMGMSSNHMPYKIYKRFWTRFRLHKILSERKREKMAIIVAWKNKTGCHSHMMMCAMWCILICPGNDKYELNTVVVVLLSQSKWPRGYSSHSKDLIIPLWYECKLFWHNANI